LSTLIAGLAVITLPLVGPVPSRADDGATARQTQAGTMSANQVARTVADSCTMSADRILAQLQQLGGRQEFTTVRHRGDFDADVPENSLTAFEESYLRCRPGVETDVRRTADDVLVMFHDTHVGKMLQPTYDPITGQGPNAALTSLTWEQLQAKTLVNIEREPQTGEKVPSLEQFLDHYRRMGGQSLLYLEVKNTTTDKATSQDEIMDVVEQVAAFDRAHPELDVFDRVVVKFRMSAFPTFTDWTTRVQCIPNLPRTPLSQVAVSRQIARDLAADASIPGSPGADGGRLEHAVQSWAQADATSDGVLSVEVTMKDSTGYADLVPSGTDPSTALPFRGVEYYAPGRTTPPARGTMASATEIVRDANKPLGQFVPIPDWVLFRQPGSFSWDQRLPNVDTGRSTVPVTAREGFFNNNSGCCYALRDRVDTMADQDDDPEQNDQRILLPWLEDVGATFLTADDTDSIDAYFKARGTHLDTGDNRVIPNRPDPAMNSMIYPGAPQLPSLMKFVNVEVVPRSERLGAWGDVRLSEDVRTTGDRSVHLDSNWGPVGLMAVYGAATLRVDVGWYNLGGQIEVRDRTAVSWALSEHMTDGVHTWPMTLGSVTVDVRATVSRQWANIDIESLVVDRTDYGNVWGDVCGTSGGIPQQNRCNGNDREGVMLLEIWSTSPLRIAPGDRLPLRTTRFSGPRPAAVTMSLWSSHWLMQPMVIRTQRVDDSAWGTRRDLLFAGDRGDVMLRYRVQAFSGRTVP
jgi:glycerophosphoryl diester phosphodiesterase